MRLKGFVISLPLHPGGLNNNQLRRSGQSQPIAEEIGNRNETSSTESTTTSTTATSGTTSIAVTRTPTPADFVSEDTEDFRVAEDTTTWSSLAITRDNNVHINAANNDAANANNNLTTSRIRRNSSVESLADYEGRNSSHEDSSHELTPSEWSDWSEEGNVPAGCRGIVNPNYPGFQHLAPSLLSDTDLTEDEHDSCNDYGTRLNEINVRAQENGNEYNNNVDESINHLCGQKNERKIFYEKPKFNIRTVTSLYESVVPPSEKCINYVKSFEDTRSEEEEEEAPSPEPGHVLNDSIEAETRLTVLEPRETLALSEAEELAPVFPETALEVNREDAWPVEVAIVEKEEYSLSETKEQQQQQQPVQPETTQVVEQDRWPEEDTIPEQKDDPVPSKDEKVPSIDPETTTEEDRKNEKPVESIVEEKTVDLVEDTEPRTIFSKTTQVEDSKHEWPVEVALVEEKETRRLEETEKLPPIFSEENLQDKRELPVEVEVVVTSVNERLQFPEIEEIPYWGKSSDSGETEVELIDLIRELKELPPQARSKIGNRQTVTSNGSADDDSESNSDSESYPEEQPTYTKLEEIDLLSSIGRDIGVDLEKYVQPVPDVVAMEAIDPHHGSTRSSIMMKDGLEDTNKLLDRDYPEASNVDTRKKEKMARNQAKRRQQQQQQQQQFRTSNSQRRPDKRRADTDNGPGGFDVYNIETAMPKIDLDAIESHLRAAREEERREDEKEPAKEEARTAKPIAPLQKTVETKECEREDLVARFDRVVRGDHDDTLQRRNDREEIRRRLAMGPDAEDLRAERGRKPSLQSRLQSGMNLQICFMNETPSDTESPCSENDASPGSTPTSLGSKQQLKQQVPARPQVLSLPPLRLDSGSNSAPIDEADFFARQARLQTEARMALAQAKEMAHMQMEVERQRLKQSPITEMVRSSLEKVGVQLGEDRRRLSRVLLTELNVAQLQVVANDLHARIAALNEALVEGLLRRDDLHMEQDSMLVDVEDLTRYLGAKQESLKKKQSARDHHHHPQQQQQQQQQQQSSSRSNQQSLIGQTKQIMKPKLTHRSLVALVRK